jgi:predicted Zn finger-like uncharacterized protein
MPVHTVTCPECESSLRSKIPIPPGKKIKCPECGTSFTTPEEKPAPEPEKPPVPAKKKPGAAPPAKAPKKSRYDDPDDDGLETYAVIKEPEKVEEEKDEDEDEDDEEGGEKKKKKSKSPDLTFALDLSVKDPRGPVQSKVIKPTNMLMLWSVIVILLNLVTLAYATWPSCSPSTCSPTRRPTSLWGTSPPKRGKHGRTSTGPT